MDKTKQLITMKFNEIKNKKLHMIKITKPKCLNVRYRLEKIYRYL